jgi:cytochrome b561
MVLLILILGLGLSNTSTMRAIHYWVGISLLILMILVNFIGYIGKMVMKSDPRIKEQTHWWDILHSFLGKLLVLCALGNCLVGLVLYDQNGFYNSGLLKIVFYGASGLFIGILILVELLEKYYK